jgi:hypothetical protein
MRIACWPIKWVGHGDKGDILLFGLHRKNARVEGEIVLESSDSSLSDVFVMALYRLYIGEYVYLSTRLHGVKPPRTPEYHLTWMFLSCCVPVCSDV